MFSGPNLLFEGTTLPGATDLPLIVVAALVGSLLSALTGSGAGVVLSIVLLPIVGVRAIVPILSIAMVISHIGRVAAFRAQADWRAASKLIALAAPGGIMGAVVYSHLPERLTAAILGIFLLALLGLRSVGPLRGWEPKPVWFALAATVFGFLNGLTIGAGILVLPLLMVFGLTGAALVATDAVVGLGMNLTKAISLGAAGTVTAPLIVYGVSIGLLTLPGAFFARQLIDRLSLRSHTRLIDATVLIAAGSMLWRAFIG
jgi:hypothetical protein